MYEQLTDEVISNLNFICAATGQRQTDEQMLFSSTMNRPTVALADAGTGKTASVAVGLVYAQKHQGIRGDKICVLSFTRDAARLISQRYDKMRKYTDLSSFAKFSTIHALCRSILTDAWGNVNFQDFDYTRDLGTLRVYAEQVGVTQKSNAWLKRCLNAINSLNSAFIFDPEDMKRSAKFKCLDITPVQFNKIRKEWFLRQSGTHTITQGDIPIHCLNLLIRNKKIRDKYHKMFDLLIIDEFQDSSVLYLKIMKEICKVPVVIGDMKQQIYAFNGASDYIVDEFMDMYPDAQMLYLTQSFRCRDEIADFATSLIKSNEPKSYGFKGIGPGGKVEILRSRDMGIEDIAKAIYHYQQNVETVDKTDIMFLFRNNFSGMSVIETLYKHNVRFRSTKFKTVMDIPVFKEMCTLIDAARDGTDIKKVWKALKLFDEFKYKSRDECPVLGIIEQKRIPWLELEYAYETSAIYDAKRILKVCIEAIDNGAMAGQIFKTLLPLYEVHIINNDWNRLDMSKEFYFNLVAPIANTKPYDIMITEEKDKEVRNMAAIQQMDGVMCYTIHTAKGLEAECIYVIDAEQGVMPSRKSIDDLIKQRCTYEAARQIRNERNLLYVACTRAKKELYVCYNSELTELISSPEDNRYSSLDEVYKSDHQKFYNMECFMDLFNFK